MASNFPERQGEEESSQSSAGFPCEQCEKIFKTKDNLARHVKAKHSSVTFPCGTCGKEFNCAGNRTRHQRKCSPDVKAFDCDICRKRCATEGGLRRHEATHQGTSKALKAPPKTQKRKRESLPATTKPKKPRTKSKQFRCRRCSEVFDNRHDLWAHGMRQHYQVGGGLQPVPWGQKPAPWVNENGHVDADLREVYETNEPIILARDEPGPIVSSYNFPVDNRVSVAQLNWFALEVYQREQHAFRLNLAFGVILQNRETNDYRYFTPYANSMVLESPIYISKRRDLRKLYLRLRRLDVLTELLRQRPDTKWIPVLVTNVIIRTYSTQYPLGMGPIPDYIINHHVIVPLVKNQQTNKPYEDNLCAFRCLALHRGYDVKSLEGVAKHLYRQWTIEDVTTFSGVSFDEFPKFEDTFKINLEVYQLKDNGTAQSVYRSRGRYDDSMYVNMYEHHLSYIKTFSKYAGKFQCQTCERHFNRSNNLLTHQRICSNKTKYVFPGGFFKSAETIFEKLEGYDINVPLDQRTFPWFIVYDFEAMLQKVSESATINLKWTQKHVPISVSICSNVPGHEEPHCIVNDDIDGLVESMIKCMDEIASTVRDLSEEKWGWVLKQLDKQSSHCCDLPDLSESGDDGDDDDENELDGSDVSTDDEDEDSDEDENFGEDQTQKAAHHLYGQMKGYMNQVPVLGFNSARYDLNLIKQVVARHLNMHDREQSNFVVKKNNSYCCISTPDLKFLDIMQFLAPGTSYVKFLKAYGVQEQKGFFPYEWFDRIDKLDETELPAHHAFHSSLKDTNITTEEYTFCQQAWEENEMTCFRDFLEWYNNLDVGPFVSAVERFQQFYFRRGIDVLKTAISVPGVARQLLFKTAQEAGANFALFDRFNEDLYHTFKNNVIGGASIIFHRRHLAGKTHIRGKKLCRKIVGFDANALYLWAIDQNMPVGPFIRRRGEDDFRPEVRDKFMTAYFWMDWLNFTGQAVIKHKLNSGEEKKVGKFPVDGWDVNTNTIYQFHGCYFHGHDCALTRDVKDKKWWDKRKDKFNKTQKTTQYLQRKGYTVVEMWECHFKEYCRCHPKIYDFINKSRPGFFQKHRGKITQEHILKGVKGGLLFGAVEVDIEVPDEWPAYFNHSTMSPYEYFQEMSPLFCTTDVPYEVIGSHMQDHVENFNLSKAPRRLLLGGMKGKQMLIATPLLKWYLDHGMKVTKIYQVVEYEARSCFQEFVKDVSDARRNGDKNPSTAIIADTMKLIGNSGYGSLIMDKTKHRDIKYVQDEGPACLLVNEPRFRKLECLSPKQHYYEAEMAKRKIKLDLPIQLGYFILQYAKLRMLQFYYDFMDVYVDRSDFEYCEMDTDSAYMAISGSGLEEIVRPDKKAEYMKGLEGHCHKNDVKADSEHHWFPRTCCSDHAKYDKRTPGLFKLEYEGDEIIGLCSKTYIVRQAKTIRPSSTRQKAFELLRKSKGLKAKRLHTKRIRHEYKFSSKGVNKRNIKAPMTIFRKVLKTGRPQSGTNRGFRARHNTIFTYSQHKRGFSYFYCKRRVANDGIHTTPLDITLCPIPPGNKNEIEDDELIQMLDNCFED